MYLLIYHVFIAFLVSSVSAPKGWTAGGLTPEKYEAKIAEGEGIDGKNCGTIKSLQPKVNGYGTLRQRISASKYAGHSIRIVLHLKTKDHAIKKWAGFWLSVDGEIYTANAKEVNNPDRKIKTKSSEWTKYQIEAPIPVGAQSLTYGAQLAGAGQLWVDEISFEITGEQPTGSNPTDSEPNNLSFEE